jgi:hypothetical protein
VLPRRICEDLAPLEDTTDAAASLEEAASAFSSYPMPTAMQLVNLIPDSHGYYLSGVWLAAEW